MKHFILVNLAILLFAGTGFSQSQVQVSINHLLDGDVFEMDKAAKNNLENDFNYSRLQYYLSNFSVIHDGGKETIFEDSYFLITTGSKDISTLDLGSHDIVKVEKLLFHLGVDEPKNHLDPATYPSDHALAPKNPSMHWGWAGGYRFIALEGKSSANLNQNLQMHCIGNKNYVPIEIVMNVESVSGILNIQINADYKEAVRDIDISSGLIQHGDLGPIVTMVENFRVHVFKDVNAIVQIIDNEQLTNFQVYPNPSNGQSINVDLGLKTDNNVIQVSNLMGQLIVSKEAKNGKNEISISTPGIYLLTVVSKNGAILANQKLIIE